MKACFVVASRFTDRDEARSLLSISCGSSSGGHLAATKAQVKTRSNALSAQDAALISDLENVMALVNGLLADARVA